MTIYYYIIQGKKYGSPNKFKIEKMAEQNHATLFGECDMSDFDGILLSSQWT